MLPVLRPRGRAGGSVTYALLWLGSEQRHQLGLPSSTAARFLQVGVRRRADACRASTELISGRRFGSLFCAAFGCGTSSRTRSSKPSSHWTRWQPRLPATPVTRRRPSQVRVAALATRCGLPELTSSSTRRLLSEKWEDAGHETRKMVLTTFVVRRPASLWHGPRGGGLALTPPVTAAVCCASLARTSSGQ